MPLVVGVAFKPVGKIHQFDPGTLILRKGDAVIVDAAGVMGRQGHHEFGIVKIGPRAVRSEDLDEPLRPVVRLAADEDYAQHERSEARQAEAWRVCKAKIKTLDVPMKLIEAEWGFDGSQVTFHFVSEGRVDFRELVRELSAVLHTRVQMHQVGSRDEAKVFPGIGPCGRPTCCSTFLREFAPVSIKMVKNQNLVQNPSKFAGLCGKLMCCLRYEQDEEKAQHPALPQVSMVVMTPLGRAKVMEVNVLQEMLTVQLETQAFVEVRARDVGMIEGCIDHAEGGCEDCASSGALSACDVPTRDKPAGGQPLPML